MKHLRHGDRSPDPGRAKAIAMPMGNADEILLISARRTTISPESATLEENKSRKWEKQFRRVRRKRFSKNAPFDRGETIRNCS
jgi:hypothetical protein